MFFKSKAIPLQSRPAMGFRGKLGERSCYKCGRTEDNNYDKFGRLQQLGVKSLDKNLNNTRPTNHIFICKRCAE